MINVGVVSLCCWDGWDDENCCVMVIIMLVWFCGELDSLLLFLCYFEIFFGNKRSDI